ncbi:hypothetical protein AAG747_07805 [Rapidithrix thailandica]|uniref:Uncharacterized protein n=1 Tax=Rapidithrix thailandica TaxID=413964 RepID=A0AAW9S1S3_9BACT
MNEKVNQYVPGEEVVVSTAMGVLPARVLTYEVHYPTTHPQAFYKLRLLQNGLELWNVPENCLFPSLGHFMAAYDIHYMNL